MTPIEVLKPIAPISSLKQVTDSQLARYAELIYRRTGIRVSPQKKMLLSNRLRRRLRETGIDDFEDYYRLLNKLRADDAEWDAFLQEITTHETYLFRDEAQWDWFRDTYLPARIAAVRSAKRRFSLRIWSAASSTGDEAYTAACCIAAAIPDHRRWRIRILGTDIGVGAVDQARAGVFGERAMRLVPNGYRERFFTKAKDACVWRARPVLTGMVDFRQHNLMDPFSGEPFDLAFLKNVLIYFDPDSKRRVIDNVREKIRPGGLLVAGAAEGIAGLVKDFIRITPWLYQRPK